MFELIVMYVGIPIFNVVDGYTDNDVMIVMSVLHWVLWAWQGQFYVERLRYYGNGFLMMLLAIKLH